MNLYLHHSVVTTAMLSKLRDSNSIRYPDLYHLIYILHIYLGVKLYYVFLFVKII